MTPPDAIALACPLPAGDGGLIQLAHGGGGRAMARLVDFVIRAAFEGPVRSPGHDGAVLAVDGPIAFTTDSYVVNPLIFPGGDIGTLAVNGTVNDLAMCGARPLYLSVGFILEEGLPIATLRRIATSMGEAAARAGVRLVTGDTKVVERGKADGMFVNTAGVGQIVAPAPVHPSSIRAGDVIVLSGDLGRHGISVMAAREGFAFETAVESDCAPLAEPVLALLEGGVAVRCLRDLTRGGLASALVEIAEAAGIAVRVEEDSIPVGAEVQPACELLGLDPLHVANEGRFVAFVAPEDGERAVALLRRHAVARAAGLIGTVAAGPAGQVSCTGPFGVERTIDMLAGEQLPRIC